MKDYINDILESRHYVANNSDHVIISKDKIRDFCENMPSKHLEGTNWIKESPFPIDSLSEKEKVHLMLVFNSVSFSYWNEPYWKVTYRGTTYQRGSWSLMASLFRAREEGIDVLNPSFLANIVRKDLEHILRGNITIPLLDERVAILQEVGTMMRGRYDNDFRNMISEASGDAVILLSKIVESFPSFEDTAHYKGRKVSFYKRAQALVESIDSISQKHLANTQRLTTLVDYIIPMNLRNHGILAYDKELTIMVDQKQLIARGSPYEVEIRGNTGEAVGEIKNVLYEKGINLDEKQINDMLWLTGDRDITPHHRTRTTAY